MSKTRTSYPAFKKLQIIEEAEKVGNREAARINGINESVVRLWRKNLSTIKLMNKSQRALRSRPPLFPQIKVEVLGWVKSQRGIGIEVKVIDIQSKALKIAENNKVTEFKASDRWANGFMRRNGLSVRAVTSIGQNLPTDHLIKFQSFKNYVEPKIVNIDLQHIGNMDEVPMQFDMPSKFTVENRGSKDVRITTTGSEKLSFTLVLCVTADGGKL